MANIIPETQKRMLTYSLVGRVLGVVGIACGMVGGALVAGSVPAGIRAYTTQALYAEEAEVLVRATAEVNTELRSEVGAARKYIQAVISVLSTPNPTQAFETVESLRGATRLQSLVYTRTQAGATLTISGENGTRQSVQDFVSALKQEKSFSSVTVPLSALTRTEEGVFDIVLDITQP